MMLDFENVGHRFDWKRQSKANGEEKPGEAVAERTGAVRG